MTKPERSPLRMVRAAAGAGAFGTGLIGAGEALHLWRAVGLGLGDGLGTLLYAIGLHGLFGFAGGLLLGLLALGAARVPAIGARLTEPLAAALAGGLAVLVGGLVIGGFRLQRDTSLGGAAAMGTALVLSLVLGIAAALLIRWLVSRSGGLIGETLLGVSLVGLVGGRMMLLPAVALPVPAPGGEDERPNVVMVVVDALRADATGPYGAGFSGGRSYTPSLDRFAAEAVVFERMYANSTWTRPSMSSLFTSRIPSGHGSVKQEDPLHPDLPHLAKAFNTAGYATAAAVTNVNLAPDFGFDMGFEAYRYHGPTRPLWATGPAVRLSLINVARLVQEKLTDRLAPERFYGEAEVMTKDALELIDGLRDRGPFFVWVHYMDPHDPFFRRPYDGHGIARVRTPHPPPEWAEEMKELYNQDIGYWDEHFGVLVQGLAERGLLENTIVAVTSDHGEEFQERGGWWHGEHSHEELSRVPLMIRLPGGAAGGKRDARLASIIDVAPTLLSTAGVDVPEGMSGRDLIGANDDGLERVVVIEDAHGGMVVTGIVWDRYKLIRSDIGNPRGFPEVQLFDLQHDALELRNLAEAEEDLAVQLLELLDRRLAGEPAAPPASDRGVVEVDATLEEDLRALGYIQ